MIAPSFVAEFIQGRGRAFQNFFDSLPYETGEWDVILLQLSSDK
jgi:hypothetical protein